MRYYNLVFLLIIFFWFIFACSIFHYKERFAGSNYFKLCDNPNHKSIADCQRDLVSRTWGDFKCEITNIMYYTIQIRRNNDRLYNYNKIVRILDHIRHNNIEFPLDCRHIGSLLTNIYQCSSNELERIWAHTINMFIQTEKLHIMSKNSENTDSSNYFVKKPEVNIFESYSSSNGDLYRNVFIRDTKTLENFPNILFLYKRALTLLLQEPRSLTYNVYHHTNQKEKQAIQNYLQNI